MHKANCDDTIQQVARTSVQVGRALLDDVVLWEKNNNMLIITIARLLIPVQNSPTSIVLFTGGYSIDREKSKRTQITRTEVLSLVEIVTRYPDVASPIQTIVSLEKRSDRIFYYFAFLIVDENGQPGVLPLFKTCVKCITPGMLKPPFTVEEMIRLMNEGAYAT